MRICFLYAVDSSLHLLESHVANLEFEQHHNLRDNIYGAGNWLIIPTADLPADFSVETYTIEGGELVRASAEVIAERKAAQVKINAAAEIVELKAYLTSTDWVVTKCMELNTPITELYPAIHAKRNAARVRINELEGGANE